MSYIESWDFVIIGEGDKGNTAIHVFDIKGKHSISENSVSYWISNLMFGAGMTIFKDTEEGKYLTEMIKNGNKLKTIVRYLNAVLIQHMSIVDIEQGIENLKNDAYELGKEDMKKEFRKLLGL